MNLAGIVHLSTVHRTRDNRIYNKECGALLDAGYRCVLVVRAERDEPGPVPIRALPTPANRLVRLTTMQLRAWRELDRLEPRLVHIHDPELIPLAWLWSRLRGALCVFDAHEDLVKQIATKRYLKPWQRTAARLYARLLTCWADRGMDAVVAATGPIAEGFSNPRTIVVHNYPWLRDFQATPAPVPGRMVYTGDLTEERKLSFMVDLVKRVRQRVPGAHLVLAGAVVGEAARRVASSSFDGELVKHLGLLSPSDVPAVISSAQLGLILLEPLPNYLTSLPTKLFEYQAAGVPFVASDFPHWRATFGEQAGVFIDSEDLAASADVVGELVQNPERCRGLGRNGRAAVEVAHNFEHEAEKLVGLMRELGLVP